MTSDRRKEGKLIRDVIDARDRVKSLKDRRDSFVASQEQKILEAQDAENAARVAFKEAFGHEYPA